MDAEVTFVSITFAEAKAPLAYIEAVFALSTAVLACKKAAFV